MPRYGESDKPKKKSRKFLGFLVSCCIFLFIICACLLAALIFIGKHIAYNTPQVRKVTSSPISFLPKKLTYARLPRDTVPLVYDLTFIPNLERGEYKGYVNVTVNITQPRKDILVHSNNLTIETVELLRIDSKVLQIANVNESRVDEVIIILPKERIVPGVYHLYIKFKGSLLDKITGFYRSQYKRENGEVRNIATSKFEPTYARQAFPCFDEPNLKAKYKVHILKPLDDKYIALSNYPVESTETHPDGVLVNFEETVSMSTYLSCFIVSDFEFTATEFNNRDTMVPFKVYATPAQLQKTEYAGEVGKKVIEYYVEYFGLPYPLPKLDMVAIPDFVSGAMEHWGLVTYRETALLYTNETHSSANKQRVATVVAHELAHSWFGNLVTMNWWDDLWLNEGFASYIEFKGVNKAEPTWNMLEQFLIADLHPVLALDSTLGSRPIIKKVEHPDQITEVFDAISYNKGASVLRMLENTVGDEVFKNGVTAYLKKYAYGNAVTQNLLDEIQAIQGDRNINVTEFMNTYTVQMGYPILNVRVDGNKYVLSQERFLIDKDAVSRGDESPYGYKWSVPVTYITDTGTVSKPIMFLHNQRELSILKPEGASWLKFNHHQVGYYRVNYPEAQWKQLIDAYGTFDVSDRTHLLEESFSIARAGRLGYEIPLELTKKLENETDYVPWSVGSSVLEDIAKNIKNSEAELDFKEYVKKLVSPSYERLSWNEEDDDDHLTRLNRVVILALACSVGHQDCLQEANVRFRDWIGNPGEPLSQDLRSLIYKFGMMGADEDTWQSVFEIFTKENDANEKLKLLNGLASVQSPALLSRLIELARNESYVRRQDYFTMLNYISLNPIGTPIVWDYVRENWPYLVQRFTLNDRYLGNLIASITATFATNIKVQEMELFFKTYPEAGAGVAARKRALETVRNNIKWRELYKTTVEDWIINNRAN